MGPTGWRWWVRTQCRHIVSAQPIISAPGYTELHVALCTRRRFHRGECRQ